MPHSQTILMRAHTRTVDLSAVDLACAWCGAPRREEHYPGSYLSLLCAGCRRRAHAWRQENYRRRLAGQESKSLTEWAEIRGYPPPPLDDAGLPVFLGRQARTPGND